MTNQLGIGVIGTGGMGARHASNVRRAATPIRLAAVMDVDADRARGAAGDSGALVFTDADELVASPHVDAVIIASPDPTHAPLARACLAAGKPALVEKPLAVDVDDAAHVVQRETSGGRRLLQVGFMRHFDPAHVAVHTAIASGEVGRPLLFRGWHRNPPEPIPPTSREVLVNAAIHDIYSARWLLDQEVTEIHVRGTTIDPERTDQLDLQVITMSFDSGGIAVVEINKDSGFGYEVGVEVTGSRGLVATPPHDGCVIRHDGQIRQHIDADWLARFDRAYAAELEAWAESLVTGRPAGPSAWDGLRTLMTASAGADSIERGDVVVVSSVEQPALYASA